MDIKDVLKEKNNLEDMEIGDYIKCEYTASIGKCGTFSNLGNVTKDLIPVTGSATPDGSFNFIKVDECLLIADRVIQHSISWYELNKGGYIEGKLQTFIVKNCLIRSLIGGIAYIDENENLSIVDKKIGIYPSTNEYSKHIINSKLGDVWNTTIKSWSMNTPSINIGNSNEKVCLDTTFNKLLETTVNTEVGFRPVLQFKNNKQKTLWY